MKNILHGTLKALSDNLQDIPFEVRFWDGEAKAYGKGSPSFVVTLNDEAGAKRILSRGHMGFGEEYMAGGVDVDGDFSQLVRLGVDARVKDIKTSLWTKMAVLFRNIISINTVRGASKNIAHHYDLGNDFYKLYLDESMTYSCAYFRSNNDTLEQAQEQKYEHICRKLRLEKGDELIDVGCGWGGMLLYAARRYGVQGVGCTLSRNQADYATEKIKRAGMENNITILLEDYRKIKGRFDKFVSIGMFEHVGKGFIPTFIGKAKELLRPGGVGLLHTIGKERDTGGDPWTLKYIFPGTHIPVLDQVVRTMGEKGLIPSDIENLRLHYAATLEEWSKRFESNAQNIEEMFDGKFVRMWRLYLNGSAGAFRWGDIRLYQILFTNGLNNSLPMTREHLYQ